MTKRLVVLVGDGPSLGSGLGRIARGLAGIWNEVIEEFSGGEADFLQVGLHEPMPWGATGWDVITASDLELWASGTLDRVLRRAKELGYEHVGIFTVWDPARCLDIAQLISEYRRVGTFKRLLLWGYFAIDARGPRQHGGFGGPAAWALSKYDAIIPYTKFGAEVLKDSLVSGLTTRVRGPMPHWLDDEWFGAIPVEAPEEFHDMGRGFDAWMNASGPAWGCVATNQPRKDLGLVFAAAKWLRDNFGLSPKIWLHTDYWTTGAWAIAQLIDDYEVNHTPTPRVLVSGCVNTPKDSPARPLSDAALRWLYSQCDVTIAPGLGEGWGYPIFESLACGVPVVHGDYGGGADALKAAEALYQLETEVFTLVEPAEFYRAGPYSLERPVFRAGDFADAAAGLDQSQRPEQRPKQRAACVRLASVYRGEAATRPWRALLEDLLETL
jgi:glycosyltransferase involved in cell wall biosynthesis